MSRIAYVYLLRVPLIIALLLVLFPLMSVGGGLNALFENLFQLDWPQTFWVTLAAILAAWSIMLTGSIVLVNAPDRFGAPPLFGVAALKGWMTVVALAIAAPT